MPLLKSKSIRQERIVERSQKHILRGNFPKFENYREMAVHKLNKLLVMFLCGLILFSICSYGAVIAKEMKLKKLHKATVALNYENAELQNLVDKAKSFNNVNQKLIDSNALKKADKVIEVNSVKPDFHIGPRRKKFFVNSVIGY